jgi:hypothetical protein
MTISTLAQTVFSYTRIRETILSKWQRKARSWGLPKLSDFPRQPRCSCGSNVGQFLQCRDCPHARQYQELVKQAFAERGVNNG